jgi:Na+-transporting methylmalonyl-CoA/oxaloacetate decarboxylase gamma subunit
MTILEIALYVLFAPAILMLGVAVVFVLFVLLVYIPWVFVFSFFGNQWARARWREF